MHIDVHAHFFNTRYLPIAGVGRKSRGLPHALARLIAIAIRGVTADDGSLERDGSWFAREIADSGFATHQSRESEPAELSPEGAIARFTAEIPPWLLRSADFDDVVREATGARGLLLAATAEPAAAGESDRRRWLRSYLQADRSLFLDVAAPAHVDDAGEPGVGGYLAFLYNLACREKTLADRHRQNSPGVELFVHVMMDMEWPYEDAPAYDYPRAIRRVRTMCRQSGGRVVPFVAFDAYRPDSLQLISRALLRQSFLGVKFYAPSGYRPDSNADAVRARDDVSPDELDRRCAAMIEFCADRDIPIMAHCTPQGMEVAPKRHSGFNADPEFWRVQLARFPKLRLCFAHAGGRSHWFGPAEPADAPPHEPWAKSIIELCTTYQNVYTDLSHMEEALDPQAGDRFAATLADDINSHASATFPLGRKVMYGSDYPMPLPGGGWPKYYQAVLRSVRDNEQLAPLVDDLFRENARAFLNLRAFLEERGDDLADEQVHTLSQFA
ncbi:MAG: amidohydrolase family protein [Phycisphaerales bacterium]|nr:amidohydrolase family protein [Phycisphaerales bacterium]